MNGATETQLRVWRCPEHGVDYGPDRIGERGHRMDWNCPDCERAAYQAGQKLRNQHFRYDHWFKASGVPPRYRTATPASIQPVSPSAKALGRAVKVYTDDIRSRYDTGSGMVLLGPPGLGKSLALAAVINEACKVYQGPIYATWGDALAELKAGFNGAKDDPRRDAIERLREAPFLALDEIAGAREASDFDHGELFGLVDYRYREELPTLVAANCTPSQFVQLVGERVADRLLEMGPQLVLTGTSQRGKVAVAGPDALEQPPAGIAVRIHSQGDWGENRITFSDGRMVA